MRPDKHPLDCDDQLWVWFVPGARVTSNQVTELPQDVPAHLHQVLVAGGGLQRLQVREEVTS